MIKTLLIGLAAIVGVIFAGVACVYLLGIIGIFINNNFTNNLKNSYKSIYDVFHYGVAGLFFMMSIVLLGLTAFGLGSLIIH